MSIHVWALIHGRPYNLHGALFSSLLQTTMLQTLVMVRSYMPSSPDLSSNPILEFVFYTVLCTHKQFRFSFSRFTCHYAPLQHLSLFNFCMWISQATPLWKIPLWFHLFESDKRKLVVGRIFISAHGGGTGSHSRGQCGVALSPPSPIVCYPQRFT